MAKKNPDRLTVIDWLQWGDFPEVLGKPNHSETTLKYIEELEKEIKGLEKEILELKLSKAAENGKKD